jgi:methanogenic corrinoid protein MtbC1
MGHRIGQIASKDTQELEEILKTHGVEFSDNEAFLLNRDPEVAKKTLQHLLLALQNYRLDIISHELNGLKLTLPPKDLALNIISPLLQQVGMDVYEGRLSIAQEHALTSIIKFHLGRFLYSNYSAMDLKNPSTECYLLTTPEGDYHEFGILLSSLLCIQHKKNFIYLGPNMPSEGIADAVKNLGIKNVILGTTRIAPEQRHYELNDFISNLLKQLPMETQLMVGGSGYFDPNKFKHQSRFIYMPTLNHLDDLLSSRPLKS